STAHFHNDYFFLVAVPALAAGAGGSGGGGRVFTSARAAAPPPLAAANSPPRFLSASYFPVTPTTSCFFRASRAACFPTLQLMLSSSRSIVAGMGFVANSDFFLASSSFLRRVSCSVYAFDDCTTLSIVRSERLRARSISASLVYDDRSARSRLALSSCWRTISR